MEIKNYLEAISAFNAKMKYSDKDWVKEMIKHHEMALTMTKNAIANSKDEFVLNLSKDILSDQQEQINEMKIWLNGN